MRRPSADERKILDLMEVRGLTHVDDLAAGLEWPMQKTLSTLMIMELYQRVRRASGDADPLCYYPYRGPKIVYRCADCGAQRLAPGAITSDDGRLRCRPCTGVHFEREVS